MATDMRCLKLWQSSPRRQRRVSPCQCACGTPRSIQITLGYAQLTGMIWNSVMYSPHKITMFFLKLSGKWRLLPLMNLCMEMANSCPFLMPVINYKINKLTIIHQNLCKNRCYFFLLISSNGCFELLCNLVCLFCFVLLGLFLFPSSVD